MSTDPYRARREAMQDEARRMDGKQQMRAPIRPVEAPEVKAGLWSRAARAVTVAVLKVIFVVKDAVSWLRK